MAKTLLLFTAILLTGSLAGSEVLCQLPPPPTSNKKTQVSFVVQMETFKKLGFVINPGVSESDLTELRESPGIEEDPYSILYMNLGRTIQREPWTPLTDRCWDFDVEAVEDHGDYISIMKNMERITRGELKFEELKDHVDLEQEKAWVSFKLRGVQYKWDLVVEDDYADPALFTRIVALTKKVGTKGKYTYFETGGQNAVIGYETPADRLAIIKATGLKIDWLD